MHFLMGCLIGLVLYPNSSLIKVQKIKAHYMHLLGIPKVVQENINQSLYHFRKPFWSRRVKWMDGVDDEAKFTKAWASKVPYYKLWLIISIVNYGQ
jgi:hypothetical protein